MKTKFDFLIVGQGLAGSLLYWSLMKTGKTVFVIDQFNASSASNIAPGIIHPITGRRIVKTWMADALIPFAEKTYREIEAHYIEELFHKKNILELIHSVKEQNDWNMKSSSAEMLHYFSDEKTTDLYRDLLVDSPKRISVAQSGWLNTGKMIQLVRKDLLRDKLLLEEEFHYDDLKTTDDGISYKELFAHKVIFCEGYCATQNPYWKHLPFLLSKGEVLTIRSEYLRLEHILSKTISILPIGEHLFKVGSTYSWDELNDTPTEKAKANLLHQLAKIINVPYEVIEHRAAIRPTVKDRRPFIGFHTKHQQIGIFNGLGTKGVLLAPYFANHFADHLLGKSELLKEVDVKRFHFI